MPHVETTETRGGFGAERFLIRPNHRLTPAEMQALQDILVVPPERIQVGVGFPEARQRGPGRLLVERGERGVIFPTPILRETRERQSTQAAAASAPAAVTGGLTGCLPSGGTMFNTRSAVAAGATDVTVSARIPRPFIITHITFVGDGTILPASDLRIKVSDDNDTSGGLATTGQNILEVYTQAVGWRIPNIPYHVFPYHLVRARGKFIKVARQNSTGGSLIFDITVDLVFLE